MSRKRRILTGVLVCLSALSARAQLLAAGTDALLLATQTYNASVELTVGERTTLGLGVLGNYHPWVLSNMRGIGVQPEWRYYFSGRPMMHHFVGVSAIAANYRFEWKETEHHGDALGAGLTFGYVLPLSERWNVDFHAGAGLVFYHERSASVGRMILPTKLGVSLAYIIR